MSGGRIKVSFFLTSFIIMLNLLAQNETEQLNSNMQLFRVVASIKSKYSVHKAGYES